jgi:uncharacterized membrane protein YqjE
MPETASVGAKGLFASLTGLTSTLVAIFHTRLELLSTDIEYTQAHFISLLALVLAALFFIGVGVVLATILLVVAFWESDRLLVLGSLTGCFLVAGVAAGAVATHRARNKPRPFAASLAELSKDRQLVSRS